MRYLVFVLAFFAYASCDEGLFAKYKGALNKFYDNKYKDARDDFLGLYEADIYGPLAEKAFVAYSYSYLMSPHNDCGILEYKTQLFIRSKQGSKFIDYLTHNLRQCLYNKLPLPYYEYNFLVAYQYFKFSTNGYYMNHANTLYAVDSLLKQDLILNMEVFKFLLKIRASFLRFNYQYVISAVNSLLLEDNDIYNAGGNYFDEMLYMLAASFYGCGYVDESLYYAKVLKFNYPNSPFTKLADSVIKNLDLKQKNNNIEFDKTLKITNIDIFKLDSLVKKRAPKA